MAPVTEALCRSYLDLCWHLDPAAATEMGVTAHDARLGVFDDEAMREHLAALTAIAAAVEDLEVEGVQDEIDRTALLDDIRITILRYGQERPQVHNPGFWLSHVYRALHGLLARRGPVDQALGQAAVDRLAAVPGVLDAAGATLEHPPSVFLDMAADTLPGGRQLIEQVAAVFGARHPDLAPELARAAAGAREALERFERTLTTELRAHPDEHSYAVGEDEFNRRLHLEHALRSSAPELWRYGLHLREELEAEVAALARAIDPGAHWLDVVARARETRPEAGGILEAYAAEIERARRHVAERGLLTLPPGALRVEATPDFLAPLVPPVTYVPPGEAADRTGVLYVSIQDEHRDAHRVHELGATAVREGFPGHHVGLLAALGHPSLVRRHLRTPVTVEGWALYAEGMMHEEEFFTTPEERLLHRVDLLGSAVRVILDVGLHTRGMRPDEAESTLREVLPLDRLGAREAVRRFCAAPTQPMAAAVGRREIRALREAYAARAGDGFRLAAFHDAFLSYGGLPVSLIRWGMGLEE